MNRLTQFLKDFPDKWLLMLLFFVVFWLYVSTKNDFSGQLLQTIVGAILGLLVGRSRSETTNEITNNIKTDTVETPQVNTPELNAEVMENEVVNVK